MGPNTNIGNYITPNIEQATNLSHKYSISYEELLLISLNIDGVNSNYQSNRVRFRLNMKGNEFFIATSNNNYSPWIIKSDKLYLEDNLIGNIKKLKEDTCDSTYFRRYIKKDNKEIPTAITLNSNSRSSCNGCEFCGTYTLNKKDAKKNDLTTPDKLRKKIQSLFPNKTEKQINDKSRLYTISDIGIVTGCFKDEEETVNHILMVNDVLKNDFGFNGLLKYIGSQIKTPESLKILKNNCENFGYYFTLECFDRRNELLKPTKRISLEESREILHTAKNLGIETSMLYILGLDSIESFEKNMLDYKNCLTRLPVINTLQDYSGKQFLLRDSYASDIEYYLRARNIMENTFNTHLKPKVWENYRGIFFTTFNHKKLDDIRI
jgi:hypothetical protein